MNKPEARCNILIEATATALSEDVVALMLVTVQKDNLWLSVNLALKRRVHQFKAAVGGNLIRLCRVYSRGGFNKLDAITIVRECLIPFPYLWVSVRLVFIVAHAHDGLCCPIHSWCVLVLCKACKETDLTVWVVDSHPVGEQLSLAAFEPC